MGIRAQGNPLASFADLWSRSGTDAYAAAPGGTTEATGGIISDYTDPGPGQVYRAHIFTSSGTFTVSQVAPSTSADILLVGGGGGSGRSSGNANFGGAGAGGMLTQTGVPLSVATYPIVNGGYEPVEIIEPGNGYWLRSSGNGEIIVEQIP